MSLNALKPIINNASASGSFQKTQIAHFPKTSNSTLEKTYWNSFIGGSALEFKQINKITNISFSPISPFDFVIASSTRLFIYDKASYSVKKTISRFKNIALSACYRNDGKTIIASDADGIIQLFDISTRNILRTLKGHKGPIHKLLFTKNSHKDNDNLNQSQSQSVENFVLSASDDQTVRLWDVMAESQLSEYNAHTDHVRALADSSEEHKYFLSGSYDHTVNLWDYRVNNNPVLSMKHMGPVEDVLFLNNYTQAVSIGQTSVRIFDIVSGGRMIHEITEAHRKTVTSACTDYNGSRLLTAGLDGNIKIYDTKLWTLCHTLKSKHPIIKINLSPDSETLALGSSDGTLSLRRRHVPGPSTIEPLTLEEQEAKVRTGTASFFNRGANYKGSEGDIIVSKTKKEKLRDYDLHIKKFEYSLALDAALRTNSGLTVYSVLNSLSLRGGLLIALSNRNEVSLSPILRFLCRHLTNPRYSTLLIDVANLIFDIYTNSITMNDEIDEYLIRLRAVIQKELLLNQQLLYLQGQISIVKSNLNHNHNNDDSLHKFNSNNKRGLKEMEKNQSENENESSSLNEKSSLEDKEVKRKKSKNKKKEENSKSEEELKKEVEQLDEDE